MRYQWEVYGRPRQRGESLGVRDHRNDFGAVCPRDDEFVTGDRVLRRLCLVCATRHVESEHRCLLRNVWKWHTDHDLCLRQSARADYRAEFLPYHFSRYHDGPVPNWHQLYNHRDTRDTDVGQGAVQRMHRYVRCGDSDCELLVQGRGRVCVR